MVGDRGLRKTQTPCDLSRPHPRGEKRSYLLPGLSCWTPFRRVIPWDDIPSANCRLPGAGGETEVALARLDRVPLCIELPHFGPVVHRGAPGYRGKSDSCRVPRHRPTTDAETTSYTSSGLTGNQQLPNLFLQPCHANKCSHGIRTYLPSTPGRGIEPRLPGSEPGGLPSTPPRISDQRYLSSPPDLRDDQATSLRSLPGSAI